MSPPSGSRERILARVRAALERRDPIPHPGDFEGWRTGAETDGTALDTFRTAFEAVGGEVVVMPDEEAAGRWLADFSAEYPSVTVGRGVGETFRPGLPEAEPSVAGLAISAARGAVAETGSLVLDARDGRRTQLLAPVHVVILRGDTVWPSAREAFRDLSEDLPSAVELHSGPSKSADIGQVMVKGVHGPGRLVALVVREEGQRGESATGS